MTADSSGNMCGKKEYSESFVRGYLARDKAFFHRRDFCPYYCTHANNFVVADYTVDWNFGNDIIDIITTNPDFSVAKR